MLLRADPKRPKQVNLRRAVSNAYYALFHAITESGASQWRNAKQRQRFARFFDHGKMRQAAERLIGRRNAIGGSPLGNVLQLFVELQAARHTADYDSGTRWSRKEVLDLVQAAEVALADWKKIEGDEVAQEALLSMLGRER